MKQIISMLTSATRVTLLMVIGTLIGINIYALIYYPDTVFNTTWMLFKDIALMSATYFYAKSTQEADIRAEKKEDDFII